MEVLMFEAEQFVADCRAAFAEDSTHKAVREVLAARCPTLWQFSKDWGSPSALKSKNSFTRMLSP
jgi:hypothetical protein